MGRWKWLNFAVLVAAGWYGYLDAVVPEWNPYAPAFRSIGAVKFAPCTAELQSGVHRSRAWYQVRLAPASCWTEIKRAWLVVGGEHRARLSGARHRFRAQVGSSSPGPVSLEIERWDSTREVAAFRPYVMESTH